MYAGDVVRRSPRDELTSDISFLDGRLPRPVLDAATRDAALLGASPHELLLSRGDIRVTEYYSALATAIGVRFSPFVRIHVPVDPLASRDPAAAACIGLLRVAGEGGLEIAAAPRGWQVATFIAAMGSRRATARRVFVTPPQALTDAIVACGRDALLEASLNGLGRLPDAMSARRLVSGWQAAVLIAGPFVALLAAWLFPGAALLVLAIGLSVFFLAAIGLRLVAAVSGLIPLRRDRSVPLSDADLPIYTVLVPLYREAGQVGRLVEALRRLDYPDCKLDIKMIAEADDRETLDALKRQILPVQFEVLAVPDAAPKTKPKALCFALAFARGSLVTIFDAEDLPDSDQLRRAAERLAAVPGNVACLQARLAWYNWPESWFTRQLAIEYASLFDVFLPALARFGLPLPLGGTSNHFRGIR